MSFLSESIDSHLTLYDDNLGRDVTIEVLDLITRWKFLHKKTYVIYTLAGMPEGYIGIGVLNEKKYTYSIDAIEDKAEVQLILSLYDKRDKRYSKFVNPNAFKPLCSIDNN